MTIPELCKLVSEELLVDLVEAEFIVEGFANICVDPTAHGAFMRKIDKIERKLKRSGKLKK